MDLEDRILNELNTREIDGNLRNLSSSSGLVDFVSNDYLGLARSRVLHSSIAEELEKYPINGSTGSRLLSGNSILAEQVENLLKTSLNTEKALIFNSGYTANLGVLSSVPKRGDTILYDELSHACIKDGARLSLANRFSFRHNDLNDLETKLKSGKGNLFIVVESVYSMDGDTCPIKEVIEIADQYNANIIVDEAHSTGVYGQSGSGLTGKYGDKIFCRIYTFGKAMGIHGAAVAGSAKLIQYLINFSRPFIYTTAPSPHSFISIKESFKFLSNNMVLQQEIAEHIALFINLFQDKLASKANRINSQHPIQALIIPGNENAKKVASSLANSGYDVRAILAPTVKKGEERLRICLHTFNKKEEITSLVDKLNDLL